MIVAVLTILAAVVGGMRALTRTVAEQAATVAKDVAKDVVEKGNESLYGRLKNNDFRHVEAEIASTVERIDRGLAEARADREAVETRTRERLDRMGDRMDRLGDRMDRLGTRMERMEARILEAVRRRPDAADEAEA